MTEIIGVIIDAATGYRLVVRRVDSDLANAEIAYEIDLHAPRNPPQASLSDHFDGNLIDTIQTIPVLSDGTGHRPIVRYGPVVRDDVIPPYDVQPDEG